MNLRMNWYHWTEDEPYKETIKPKELGIKWEKSVVQTIADQTWFFNCTNVPDPLPNGWEVMDIPLHELIGYGLDEDDVKQLTRNRAITAKDLEGLGFIEISAEFEDSPVYQFSTNQMMLRYFLGESELHLVDTGEGLSCVTINKLSNLTSIIDALKDEDL